MTPTIDLHLENYTLEAELSRNEWSTLYRGVRKADDALVVVKIIAPLFVADNFLARRFIYVVKQTAKLEHPHILRFYETEQDGEALFCVHDFVNAPTLAQVIETEGPLSLQRTQKIAAQIASALDYAHQKSIMHGDLSAHTILLGPGDHVWLTDFSQSQVLFGTDFAHNGLIGHAFETLAPERTRGQGPSRQADLYSLGILCYQMLAGRLPFSGPASTVLHAQAYKQPPLLHRVNPGIPVSVGETINRMLAKSADLRYNTGAEFVRAMGAAKYQPNPALKYQVLIPLEERERRAESTLKKFVSFCISTVVIGAIALLSIWAGYELGVNHAGQNDSPAQSPLDRVSPAAQSFIRDGDTLPAPSPPVVRLVATPTQTQTLSGLSDNLLPARSVPTSIHTGATRRPTPTLTPTLMITPVTSPSPAAAFSNQVAPTATPAPSPASQQPRFIFGNPTGFDLIVDLTGPVNDSVLVPPYSQHEFVVEPGPYQYIVHTVTGKNLASKVKTFDLAPGQVVELDYHSPHDATLPLD